jgi:hypothetical protein
MDLASLPQSRDVLGMLRFTAKLSDYIANRLPVVTGQLPLAYDLDTGWLWRLPGRSPWDRRYIAALARLLSEVTAPELREKAEKVDPINLFDKQLQIRRVGAFIREVAES